MTGPESGKCFASGEAKIFAFPMRGAAVIFLLFSMKYQMNIYVKGNESSGASLNRCRLEIVPLAATIIGQPLIPGAIGNGRKEKMIMSFPRG
jgi:hypothetical protein